MSGQTGAVRHLVPGKITREELAAFRAILAGYTSRIAAARALGVTIVTLDAWCDGFVHARSLERIRKIIAKGKNE